MKTLLITAAAIMAFGTAQAADVKSRGCMACHAVDKKLVGPSYQDIANKYRGQTDAADKLAQKIRAGGAGTWGPVPMPPHAHIGEAEAKQLAQWVLAIK